MTSNIETVKRLNNACQNRDFETVKSLLHPGYTLKSPDMQASSPEEFIKFMEECPAECTLENLTFIEDGDQVVQIFDMVSAEPVSYRVRMCDVLKLQNGKVRSEEMFYDTAAFPPEAKEMMEKAAKKKQKAA
jgi:ketosteroid isomerase-like protein